jgi:hypothetical protein
MSSRVTMTRDSFILAVFAAVMAGVSLSTLHSGDICFGSMHDFIYAVAVSSMVQLAIAAFGVLLGLMASCCTSLESAAVAYDSVAEVFLVIASIILNLLWIVWGIVVLAHHECRGTRYHTLTTVLVVLSGLCLISSVLNNRK